MEGTAVAEFDATTAGSYRVAVSTGPHSEGLVAVGEGFPAWTQDWVAVLPLTLLAATGILIIVVPIVIYDRRRRTASDPPPSRR